MFLDIKIYMGVEPKSVVCLPSGKIYVLTDSQVEVYDRMGVQISIHDSENFACLAAGPANYLMIGTTEGDLIMMEPEHWQEQNLFHCPLKLKTEVVDIQICS